MKSFRRFVENRLKESASADISYYALTQVAEEMDKYGIEELDSAAVQRWFAHMLLGGMKVSTCKRYIGRVHALHSEWLAQNGADTLAVKASDDDTRRGDIDNVMAKESVDDAHRGDAAADPFAGIGTLLGGITEINDRTARHNLSLLPRLLSKNESSADYQTVCIFLYLLYDPSAGIEDMIRLTFDDTVGSCQQVDDIIASQSAGKGRKYLFRLQQGRTTDARIARNMRSDLRSLMRVVGMRCDTTDPRDAITGMWISAAISADIPAEEIRQVVGHIPPEYNALRLFPEDGIDPVRREQIISLVADTLNDNTSHWYAMRLRAGVDRERVEGRIRETLPGRLETMEIYSPTRESVKREGHRIKKEIVPMIPGLLFFKTGANRVRSLLAKIGDLAWCYRTGTQADSPYSVISRREMARFQRCVGQFTDDIRIELVDNDRELTPGRMVRVTGGLMAGYEGEITDVEGEPGMRLFSLRISDTARASWVARVEDYNLELIHNS